MNINEQLAERLFSHITKTPEDYEKEYPKRNLPEGAVVTRFAPSPTGYLHIGGLFASMVERLAAKNTGGVFFLRIEDTDKKREVENGVSEIIKGLKSFGMSPDEGVMSSDSESGSYGPYTQSKRTPIYQAYVKSLVQKGLAYPCFCSAEELSEIRAEQEKNKITPGYYGEYARCRELDYDTVIERLDRGDDYVIRLKSPGNIENRITIDDGLKGVVNMPENNQDIVLLKTDGTPTYHLAHAVDDHLMRTTHVIRGDEWLSSVPIHVQLFDVLGFEQPKYVHIAPIRKEDNGGKRKISKRKDPEAAVSFYHSEGYPSEVVIEYLMTLANSNFEEWRAENPTAPIEEFVFSFDKMSQGGALFDIVKLNDISKNRICLYSAEQVYDMTAAWAKEYNNEFYGIISSNPDYTKSILAIERGNEKPRKDIAKWSDVQGYAEYFYNEIWDRKRDFADNLTAEAMIEIIEEYKKVYDPNGSAEDWFPAVRDMSEKLGYAKAPKFYKKNPEQFRGHVGDVSGVIRVAVTGRRTTPDLYSIMQTLGYDEVMKRFDESIAILKEEM